MSTEGPSRTPGIAAVKAEYLIPLETRPIPDDDSAERVASVSKSRDGVGEGIGAEDGDGDEGRGGRGGKRKWTKEERKKRQGANKGRRFGKTRDTVELCWKFANGGVCDFGEKCRFTHNIEEYLKSKPADVHFPFKAPLGSSPPYVLEAPPLAEGGSIDYTTTCPIFEDCGECKHGIKCRFLGAHVKKSEDGKLEVIRDDDKVAHRTFDTTEVNYIGPQALKLLRSKKYPTPITKDYMDELSRMQQPKEVEEDVAPAEEAAVPIDDLKAAEEAMPDAIPEEAAVNVPDKPEVIVVPEPKEYVDTSMRDVPLRFSEKRRLDWKDKLYLAPLTTVGNLPFRRICVKFGADITCGEMGLATSFLSGSKEEWSLVRRHPSEKTFGIQVAGNKPSTLTHLAEVIGKEFGGHGSGGGSGGVDFVDLNCGCPIDLVYKSGSGSALLDTPGKLGKILIGMNKALGDIPLTVKLRTGVKDGRNTAHKLMPRLNPEWGVGAVTLHGRTRQQRYTKLADWEYIKQCTEAVRARIADEDLPPIPIFGGGDCYSSRDYWACVEQSGVDGVMIGRGALIKPWIFTEIRERREWDISSRERLEIVRDYAYYAINHFGSDTAGVNTARRYLCESLSFQHRYVPLGLLEVIPGRLNDRPPAFRGRDELETLLASPNSQDWVKISEMFLGPAPDGWVFTPKHKSNAYGPEVGVGMDEIEG